MVQGQVIPVNTFCLARHSRAQELWNSMRKVEMLEEILFRPPLYAAAASGLPAIILSVEQAHKAMSGALPAAASSRVHWRLAATMLKFAFTGTYADIALVRQNAGERTGK
jgi:hypothetical protein